MIAIIDYGVGNLASIHNMLKKIGIASKITSHPEEIELADKIILPGVGAFDTCVQKLNESQLLPIIEQNVFQRKKPLLGICVGMQMLTNTSEEGSLPGLGWIQGHIQRFVIPMSSRLKVPHMGWRDVQVKDDSPLFYNLSESSRFYFVHSYHAVIKNETDVLATAHYGFDFAAAIGSKHIVGVQFHPEKSHKFGLQLLSNFANRY